MKISNVITSISLVATLCFSTPAFAADHFGYIYWTDHIGAGACDEPLNIYITKEPVYFATTETDKYLGEHQKVGAGYQYMAWLHANHPGKLQEISRNGRSFFPKSKTKTSKVEIIEDAKSFGLFEPAKWCSSRGEVVYLPIAGFEVQQFEDPKVTARGGVSAEIMRELKKIYEETNIGPYNEARIPPRYLK